ncbi:hypothetical protein M902_3020 [Bacteriovorax sp. BAL6_X]|uniref:hypothetical protein n=1 Tax=Bacteriovorax sp. BAL6_X TaxID=1201290 RepID=UPI00038593EE|nr:hypothetical protein [Bacteriovorax sp. BAL6_X]EPZ51468.1 hypothetical protein M902_3020 [Bacteriovorax sp. BAL6_X]
MRLVLIALLLLCVSCSLPPKRGGSEEEISYNRVLDLKKSQRLNISTAFAQIYKIENPDSARLEEIDYLICENQQSTRKIYYQNNYLCWSELSRKYPNYRTSDVKRHLDENRGKRNPKKRIGLYEFSFGQSFLRSSSYKAISISDKTQHYSLFYTSHENSKYSHALLIGLSFLKTKKLKINQEYDLQQNVLSYGYSFRAQFLESKLNANVEISPTLVSNFISKEESDKSTTKVGGLIKVSVDYLLYKADYSIFNPYYYLTFGVSHYQNPGFDLDGVGFKGGGDTNWFIGIKL